MYEYWAKVVSVHDGDTITVDIDLGFNTWLRGQRLRLAGISALELSMPGGREARINLMRELPAGTTVKIASLKADIDPAAVTSFDRYVVTVWAAGRGDLGDELVAEGWAVRWDGRSKPTPYPAWPIVRISPA